MAATKLVPELRKLEYKEKLKILDLTTLQIKMKDQRRFN